MSDNRGSKLLVSILARSLMVALVTVLGAISGMIVGYYWTWIEFNPSPPSPATMGAESAGAASLVIFAINLALGAAGGAIVGLIVGIVIALIWPRRNPKS